jgi:hypothetical protein
MECEKYLVMKCKYIIQINQHFLSLYLVIFKNAVLPVLFFTHIIIIIIKSYNPKGVYTPDPPSFVLKFAFNHLETLL